MRLFKYLKREYAQRMLNNGAVYIGTLSYYRNIENKAIADRDEGKKKVVTNFQEEIVIKDKKDGKDRKRDKFCC